MSGVQELEILGKNVTLEWVGDEIPTVQESGPDVQVLRQGSYALLQFRRNSDGVFIYPYSQVRTKLNGRTAPLGNFKAPAGEIKITVRGWLLAVDAK